MTYRFHVLKLYSSSVNARKGMEEYVKRNYRMPKGKEGFQIYFDEVLKVDWKSGYILYDNKHQIFFYNMNCIHFRMRICAADFQLIELVDPLEEYVDDEDCTAADKIAYCYSRYRGPFKWID
jgi:hypothetical protein